MPATSSFRSMRKDYTIYYKCASYLCAVPKLDLSLFLLQILGKPDDQEGEKNRRDHCEIGKGENLFVRTSLLPQLGQQNNRGKNETEATHGDCRSQSDGQES